MYEEESSILSSILYAVLMQCLYCSFDHQMLIDPSSKRLFVFGGKYYEKTDGSPSFSGLYTYDLRSRSWTRHTEDVDPGSINWLQEHRAIPSRTGHSMLCDNLNQRLLVLAGQRSDHYLSDLWSFSLLDGRIECLDRDYSLHGGPDGGFTQRAVIDSRRREFVLLSGLMKEKVPPHFTQVKVGANFVPETSYLIPLLLG